MAPPRAREQWKDYVFQHAADHPKKRAQALQELIREDLQIPAPAPLPEGLSLNSIQRLLGDWDRLTPEEKEQYFSFRWPDSMVRGALPWEAAGAALELLRMHPDPRRRPAIRLTKWFWRVTLAAPDSPATDRVGMALEFAALEAGDLPISDPSAEVFLLQRPWESDSAREAYEKRISELGLEPFHPSFKLEAGMDVERALDAIEELSGVRSSTFRQMLHDQMTGVFDPAAAKWAGKVHYRRVKGQSSQEE